jgi:ATP-dependent RNA helicase RhlE
MPFSKFNLHPDLLKGVQAMGFTEPRPVQAQILPIILEGKDALVSSETGSGKTAAFLLPVMNTLLKQHQTGIRVLILEPTRELAAQVETQVRDLGRFTAVRCAVIVGGASFKLQKDAVDRGAQILVATPGRLLDHLQNRTFKLNQVHTLILDEGDRMLDMGFAPAIRAIMPHVPTQRQTLLFSATLPPQINNLAHQILKDPVRLELSQRSAPPTSITQMLYPVSRSQKDELLGALLRQVPMQSTLIFTRTKRGADYLSEFLKAHNFSVATLHSDRSQAMRDHALEEFRKNRFSILVATDIASRGLDIKGVSHVINYDVPHSPEDYVHRIGRTGRAEASGDAFTLVTPDDERMVLAIEQFIGRTLPRGVLPDFPYRIPPRLTRPASTPFSGFGRTRRTIASSRSHLFRRR